MENKENFWETLGIQETDCKFLDSLEENILAVTNVQKTQRILKAIKIAHSGRPVTNEDLIILFYGYVMGRRDEELEALDSLKLSN
jgi:hypothetical protein